MNINYFNLTNRMTTYLSWNFFVTVDNKVFRNFDIYSTLMAIEQCEIVNMPRLLWHGPILFNSHVRGPVTRIPVTKRLAVELSLPSYFNDLGLFRPGIEPRSPACEANAPPLSHSGGEKGFLIFYIGIYNI